MVTNDRLSDLPDSMLLHILSFVCNMKQVVRTSVLSKRWRFLWKSVSVSLSFSTDACSGDQGVIDYVASINRELHYSLSFKNIRKLSIRFRYEKRYDEDVDTWVHFATQAPNVEEFTLLLYYGLNSKYEFPQFAYNNSSLKNLVLRECKLNPCGSVSWSSLISLSIGDLKLTSSLMEKILSGCPNLECLEILAFCGIVLLQINSVKLKKLIIGNCIKGTDDNNAGWLEILAPHIRDLQLLGSRHEIRLRLSNVASLVTAVLNFTPHFEFDLNHVEDDFDKESGYAKELLESLVHVNNLELGPWCIEMLSILELKGWQSPASSRKILTINSALVEKDFPAICSLLQSSPDLETLVIDWSDQSERFFLSRFIKENEKGKMVEKHILNCSLLHLKTINIIHFNGPLYRNKFILPLVKHLLKNAEVLEKMIIPADLSYNRFEGSIVSSDFVEMAQDILTYPRSSPHAAVVFTYYR